METEKKQYKIKVSENTQELIKTVKFADDQNAEYDSKSNTTTYMFSSTQFDMIFNYLVSFADEALPLEPVELVEQYFNQKGYQGLWLWVNRSPLKYFSPIITSLRSY